MKEGVIDEIRAGVGILRLVARSSELPKGRTGVSGEVVSEKSKFQNMEAEVVESRKMELKKIFFMIMKEEVGESLFFILGGI